MRLKSSYSLSIDILNPKLDAFSLLLYRKRGLRAITHDFIYIVYHCLSFFVVGMRARFQSES